MLRLLRFLVLCFIGAFIISWLITQPGKTTLIWLGWQVQIKTSLLAVFLVLLIIFLLLIYRMIMAIMRWPFWLSHNWQARRKIRGEQALGLGMVALAVGDTSAAYKQAKKAEKLLGRGILADLLRAQTAHAAGDDKAASRYFTSLSKSPATAYFGHIGLMRLQHSKGEKQASIDAAHQALLCAPDSLAAGSRLLADDLNQKNWAAALERLSLLLKQEDANLTQMGEAQGLAQGQLARPKLLAAHLCLMLAEDSVKNNDNEKQKQSYLTQALIFAPDFTEAAARLAQISAGTRPKQALKRLEQDFCKNPHRKLADMIAELSDDNDGHLIARFVKLADRTDNDNYKDDQARLIAAEYALERGIWGAASSLLELVRPAAKTNQYFLLLAQLMRTKSDSDEAHEDREAEIMSVLHHAAHAPHGPNWFCRACGVEAGSWQINCPSCHVFGQIDWIIPANGTKRLALDRG